MRCPGPRPISWAEAKAAVLAGSAAGAAFALTLEADLRLTGRNVDDLLILGWPFAQERRRARRVGLALHVVNSLALARLYATMQHAIPGPPWLKGVVFASAENVLLYPVTVSRTCIRPSAPVRSTATSPGPRSGSPFPAISSTARSSACCTTRCDQARYHGLRESDLWDMSLASR